jgi:hypothetical protein
MVTSFDFMLIIFRSVVVSDSQLMLASDYFGDAKSTECSR